jgi:hypothetical protein
MDSGWDIKHLLKLMVTSEAYRQSSKSTPELNERDPDNRLLARGPRFRPTGELLRDQALAVSGLLSEKMFGVPVRPVTPNLGLSTAFGRSNDWEVSKGEDAHRRSLYTEVRRNSPYASFTTFDASLNLLPNRGFHLDFEALILLPNLFDISPKDNREFLGGHSLSGSILQLRTKNFPIHNISPKKRQTKQTNLTLYYSRTTLKSYRKLFVCRFFIVVITTLYCSLTTETCYNKLDFSFSLSFFCHSSLQ